MTSESAPDDPRARNWLWWSVQLLMQNLFTFWLRYRVLGTGGLPEGGALLLINHQSSLDPLVTAVALKRPVSYLARHELFDRPGVGWIMRQTFVMPIRRESAGTESIRLSVERLNAGFYVGLFPEGTRSEDGKLHELKPGFLAIVRRAQVPVIPVGIAGARNAYPRGAVFVRPRTVRVVIGEPIPEEVTKELSQKGREQEFLNLIRERMLQCIVTAENWRQGIPPDQSKRPRPPRQTPLKIHKQA